MAPAPRGKSLLLMKKKNRTMTEPRGTRHAIGTASDISALIRHTACYVLNFVFEEKGMVLRIKSGCGTKQPTLKRDKTADFQNGTKQPIFKTGQNNRFSKRNKMSVVTANMHGT